MSRVSLAKLNSFGVAATAQCLAELRHEKDVEQLEFNPATDLLLGGGSNVLLATDVPGQAVLNRLTGRKVIKTRPDSVLVEVAAGENWHEFVRWTLQQGYSGLENLSLIPGLCGAAPIQNIGAYGVELADCFHSVTAWDLDHGRWRTFDHEECSFGYRDSVFKSQIPCPYLLTSLRLNLSRQFRPRLAYDGIRQQLESAGVSDPAPLQVSDAVIALRRAKLPDPARVGNAGSFFKNPVTSREQATDLRSEFPQLPAWPQADSRVKLSAAWMIEQCGWRGFREGDAGVSEQHALVLVNHAEATGRQLLRLARRVQDSVKDTFGIELENEPGIISFEDG